MEGVTISCSEMWDNYIRFMEAVVPMPGGVARLFYEPEGFQRALDVVPSPNSGLDFCMGCFSEMGPGVVESIRYGSMDKIFMSIFGMFRDMFLVFRSALSVKVMLMLLMLCGH
ncbi:MAG: hypothetical protein VX677_13530 [Candidatus Poribacteria bacterium]|nr:hypothetical protein [Candidatus Poribacteria bacterium]